MNKIAVITDTHFGCRTDSLVYDATFRNFFDTVFFPSLDANNIRTVLHLGDVFDRRKYINFQILENAREYFFDPLAEREIELHIIPGNHDTYYKNTNRVNSLKLLLGEYPNIQLHQQVGSRIRGGEDILFVPWICPENESEVMQALAKADQKICVGHFPITGFQMHKGTGAEEGMDPNTFKKFDMVLTGHFHHRSSQGNIHYLGTPYEMTWSDYNDPKGFHLLDPTTRELEFIENPYQVHVKVFWDDSTPQDHKVSLLAGRAIKIVVVNKTEFFEFDNFLDALQKTNPIEQIQIIEDHNAGETSLTDEDVDVEDTLSLLGKYVDGLDEMTADKERVKTLLKGLYVEAQHTDDETD